MPLSGLGLTAMRKRWDAMTLGGSFFLAFAWGWGFLAEN
jgi:hypothetical protein